MPNSSQGNDFVSSSAVSSPVAYDLDSEESLVSVVARRRYPSIFPAFALSLFVSTASAFSDPWRFFQSDPSVVLGLQHPRRQRISLAEARRIALQSVLRDVARARRAAEIESTYFTEWFGWKPE